MILSIDSENAFDKIQHQFMRKTFKETEVESNFLNMRKNIYKNTSNYKMFSH